MQRWRAEEYPALQARAKALGALIMFTNEAAMRSGDHPGTTWAPRGGTPVVRATRRRVSVQMLSAVATGGQLQSRLHESLANATVFRSFLEQLMLGATQRISLSVDGHSTHKAKPVGEYVASTDGMIELHFLPPYPPQLNPEEQV